MLWDGLEDMRANFKSKEDDTGGEVAVEGEMSILETPPVMGIFPDMLRRAYVDDDRKLIPKNGPKLLKIKNSSGRSCIREPCNLIGQLPKALKRIMFLQLLPQH